MPVRLSEDQVRFLRITNQQLNNASNKKNAEVASVVKNIFGIQAQDAGAALLGLWVRSAEVVKLDLESALFEVHSIIRTWSLRGTLHLVNSEDLKWLLDLLGPIFIKSSRGRREQLGLNLKTELKAIGILKDLLVEYGSLTRTLIVEKLAERGIKLEGQAAPHLLRLAALQGIICYGAERNGEATYVLLSDWIHPLSAHDPANPLSELAVRYLTAFAPATPKDFSTWSGLSLIQAHAAWKQIADSLVEVSYGNTTGWIIDKQVALLEEIDFHSALVRLLPRYDTYLLGYNDRSLIISPEFKKRIYPGGGLLHPAVVVNGRVVGAWYVKHYKDRIVVNIEPFEVLTSNVKQGLEDQINRLSGFYNKKTKFVTAQ